MDALLFDLYHTLLDGADTERDRVVAEMAIVLDVSPPALVRAYHESWPDRLVRWTVEETIEILAARIGGAPAPHQIARAAALRRALARRLLTNVPQSTLDTLSSLRDKGFRLALISNATSETAEEWPDTPLAKHFDAALFSSTVHIAKPDPAIYRLAATHLNTTPARCHFIGDGADNELPGAQAAGMTATRTRQFRDSAPTWPGPTITALSQLTQ